MVYSPLSPSPPATKTCGDDIPHTNLPRLLPLSYQSFKGTILNIYHQIGRVPIIDLLV